MQWLSNFNEEYLSGNFNHKGKKLHKTKAERRACYTRNNARNRDTFSINRTKGWVAGGESMEELLNKDNPGHKAEDNLLDLIDMKQAEEKKPTEN